MKTWHGYITIGLGYLSSKDIQNHPERFERFFKDLNNPTEDEIRRYFARRQEDYAGSNDGSEEIANADIEIEERVS